MSDYAAIDRENRERWNNAHAEHHPGALSGSTADEVLQHHQITHLIRPGLRVLDIGVGLGGMSEFLHGRGCVVDALDAADVAQKTVERYICDFYLAERIDELPTEEYDLAISMLVAQHMCERNLRRQIKEVFRALKPGGLFALHLAGATEGPLNNLTCEIPPGMDGAMCRTPEYTEAMVQDVLGGGYRYELSDHRMEWPQFKSYWYFVRIFKQERE